MLDNYVNYVTVVKGGFTLSWKREFVCISIDSFTHSVVGREKLLIGSAVSRTHSLLITHRNKHKSSSLTS